jgi:hypothetical protein
MTTVNHKSLANHFNMQAAIREAVAEIWPLYAKVHRKPHYFEEIRLINPDKIKVIYGYLCNKAVVLDAEMPTRLLFDPEAIAELQEQGRAIDEGRLEPGAEEDRFVAAKRRRLSMGFGEINERLARDKRWRRLQELSGYPALAGRVRFIGVTPDKKIEAQESGLSVDELDKELRTLAAEFADRVELVGSDTAAI